MRRQDPNEELEIEALAVTERGASLSPLRYGAGPLGVHDCLVEVSACGICHSDLHMIDDDWRTTRYPLVPGHEVVGRVVARGAEAGGLEVGQRVGVGWQRSSCLRCRDCLRGDENLCARQRGTITHGHGGFASHLAIDARFCFPIPEGLSDEEAAPLLCGGITVYSGLRAAGMRGGQSIGVLGIGGLGPLAVQFAARMGNRVTAFTTSEDKAQLATDLGAAEAVLLEQGSPPRCSRPLDILLNTAPANLDWAAWLDLLDSDGTLCLVGVPSAPLKLPAFSLLSRRRRVMGSPIGGRAEMFEMLQAAVDLGVRPMIEAWPMAEADEALARLRENQVRYRAVLKM